MLQSARVMYQLDEYLSAAVGGDGEGKNTEQEVGRGTVLGVKFAGCSPIGKIVTRIKIHSTTAFQNDIRGSVSP